MRQEWKNIFHNPWIIVVLIAIILIPSIYSTVFLGSMWDPYGNTKNIPVAIVNEDQEIEYGDEKLNIGKDLAESLEDNDSMDFQVVNASKAKEGLEKGDYYMIITIPQDFSSHATTLLDQQPQKMELTYTTNPGTNYIASKMDDSAIEKIKSEVSSTVTKTYAKTLFHQVHTLSNGLNDAVDGTHKLKDGMNELSLGNQKISDNLKLLSQSSLVFTDGASSLTQGLKDYTDGVLTVNDGMYTLKSGVDKFNQVGPLLQQGVTQLNDGSQKLNQGIQNYTSGVEQVYAGSQQLVGNNDKLNSGVDSLSKGVKELSSGNQQITDGISQLLNEVNKGSMNLNQYLALYKKINQISPNLASIMKEQGLNKQTLTALYQQGKINENMYQMLSSQLPEEGLPSFENMLETLNANMNIMSTSIETINQGQQSLQQGINKLQTHIDTDFKEGLENYTQGVNQIHNGLQTLHENTESLTTGSQQLSNAITTLSDQTPELVENISSLQKGVNQLYDGTSLLVSHQNALLSGSQQLTDGSKQMSSGANQLADGSLALQDGLQEASKGVDTLNNGLEDGAKQTDMKTTDSNYDMMASPVTLSHKEISVVENNGHAMAPYMMSVALYVAGMAFVLMYPLRRGIKEAKNGLKYWLSKASVMYTVSTIAAIVLITALRMINGFQPQQLLMTYLFAIVVSAAFMSIITLLTLTTGYIGDFILLVFMIVNLGGSAGTYPLETSGLFYKAIHAFVPYTYSVNGFRKTISMVNASVHVEILIFIGIIIVCSLLTILYFHYKNKEDKHLIPQAFETNH